MRPTWLDDDAQQTFERDGYVVVPFLDADEVAALRDVFDRFGRPPGDPGTGCVSTFITDDAAYKAAVVDAIAAVLDPHVAEHFDDQVPLPAAFIVKWTGEESMMPLHQDTSLVDETRHTSAEIWVALEDTDATNGELWMVPGSHRWLHTIRGINAWFRSPFEGLEERIMARHAVPVPLAAGEAIVFNHAVLHFSYPNRTDRERLVAIADVLPREAPQLLHYGNEDGSIEAYEVDPSFWLAHTPAELGTPPDDARRIGVVDYEFTPLTAERLDELVAAGDAIDVGG